MVNSASPLTAELLAKRIHTLINEEAIPVGSHLTEASYVTKLKVSRTPIRAAFQFLEEQGVVKRQPNRGFFLVDTKRGLFADADEPLEQGSSISPLCFTIGVDYLNNQIAGKITEAELAKKYTLGRSTILQAMHTMEAEGWVSRLLGYGWEFNEFLTSQATYDQCFRFRLLIEPAALREPGYQINKKVFKQLRESLTEAVSEEGSTISERQMYINGAYFHESIVNGSNNQFLIESLKRANRLRRLIEYHVYARRESPVPEYKEHLAILDLLEAGDNQQAAVYLTEHLERTRQEKMRIAQGIFAR
ncbi:GntR family transcriptional regulator [Vreelandella zhanjiangensis]|uniref:GntR family transcriptional regulator n=1 Tax=Vreelandella zhanjiangensis TaxID=1121960 RepID=UPI00402A9D9F